MLCTPSKGQKDDIYLQLQKPDVNGSKKKSNILTWWSDINRNSDFLKNMLRQKKKTVFTICRQNSSYNVHTHVLLLEAEHSFSGFFPCHLANTPHRFCFILQGLTLIADITWLSCYGNAALCIPKGTKGDFHLRTSEQTRCPIGKDHGTSILNVISKIPFIFYISFSQ